MDERSWRWIFILLPGTTGFCSPMLYFCTIIRVSGLALDTQALRSFCFLSFLVLLFRTAGLGVIASAEDVAQAIYE